MTWCSSCPRWRTWSCGALHPRSSANTSAATRACAGARRRTGGGGAGSGPPHPEGGGGPHDSPPAPPRASPALGSRADPLLAEPLPETAGPLREDGRQLRRPTGVSMRVDRLPTGNIYLRIINKSIPRGKSVQSGWHAVEAQAPRLAASSLPVERVRGQVPEV